MTTELSFYQTLCNRNMGLLDTKQQMKIKETRVAISGLGGIGSPIAEMLCRVGFTRFSLLDHGRFELTNLNRQIFCYTDTDDLPKTDVTESFLKRINPDVQIEKFTDISEENVGAFLKDAGVIVMGIAMFTGKSEIDLSSVPEGRSRWRIVNAFMPNFLFTALHPVTLVFFSAAFASLPLADSANQLEFGQLITVTLISLGVFSGAMIWWTGLAWSVDTFIRNKITTKVLIKIKKAFAVILVLLGAGMLISHTLFV